MKKISLLIPFIILFTNCKSYENSEIIKSNINLTLNNWHKNIANANFDASFKAMATDAIYIGTDASENWTKKQFMNFSKPYFDKKQTWYFKPLQRNVYISKDGQTAWFDELLDTWMKICRGTGVLIKQDKTWKIT